MHENLKLTIAIDGPSVPVTRLCRRKLHATWPWRTWTPVNVPAATYRALELGIDLNDAEAIAKAVEEMPLVCTNIKEERDSMGSTDIREEIRSEHISSAVSGCGFGGGS